MIFFMLLTSFRSWGTHCTEASPLRRSTGGVAPATEYAEPPGTRREPWCPTPV